MSSSTPPDVEKYRPSEAELADIEDDSHPKVQKNGLYVLADETDVLEHLMVFEFIDEGLFDPNASFQENVRELGDYADAHLQIGEQIENGDGSDTDL